MVRMKIGEIFLNRKMIDKEWSGKELYNILMEFQDADAASGNPQFPSMKYFYLKIHGYYNEKIFENFSPCKYCPKNSEYQRFEDYNELIGFENKEPVIVIKSPYNDFRDFKIVCAYYSSKEYKDEYVTMFELYGNKKSIFNKIGEFFINLFKVNTL